MNATDIAAIDRRPARAPARRRGATTASTTKAAKGKSRTSSGSRVGSVIALAPEQVETVGLDRPPYPEDRDDDGQAHRDLGHRDGDREEREDHAGQIAVEPRERHEVDVDRVQHQLDSEEDPDRVAAREHAEESDREHQRRQHEVRLEADHSSLRAKYTRSEEHTSELQSHHDLVCRLLLEKKKKKKKIQHQNTKKKYTNKNTQT